MSLTFKIRIYFIYFLALGLISLSVDRLSTTLSSEGKGFGDVLQTYGFIPSHESPGKSLFTCECFPLAPTDDIQPLNHV